LGLEHRPFIGTFQLNKTQLVQHTPDGLVYVNGDTSLPGCPKCNGRIDIQKFITEISVDTGVTAGEASASMSISIPLHHVDSFARDAQYILRPGLEVHVYLRGYFPVNGMYGNLAESRDRQVTERIDSEALVSEFDRLKIENPAKSNRAYKRQLDALFKENKRDLRNRFTTRRMLAIVQAAADYYKIPPEWIYGTMLLEASADNGRTSIPVGTSPISKFPGDTGIGVLQTIRSRHRTNTNRYNRYARKHGFPSVWWEHSQLADPRLAIWSKAGDFAVLQSRRKNRLLYGEIGALQMGRIQYADPSRLGVEDGGKVKGLTAAQRARRRKTLKRVDSRAGFMARARKLFRKDRSGDLEEGDNEFPSDPALAQDDFGLPEAPPTAPDVRLEDFGLGESGLEDVMAYPYYHVFHGVMTQVDHSWSGGFFSISVSVASMLHFWQYHTMSTNASLFGARAVNSGLRTSLVGHNFTGMHPYEIIYTLHHDMVGAAGGVGGYLSQKTNQTAKTEVLGESLFSLNVRYWKRRFQTRMTKLRMHGATGELFSTVQAAFLGRTGSSKLTRLVRQRFADPSASKNLNKKILRTAQFIGLFKRERLCALQKRGDAREATGQEGATLDSLVQSIRSRPARSGRPRFEINIVAMQAFVANIGNFGQVNLFESTYESKLDIALKVCEVTGFEFYQDVDGDFVFKPPMYNLDTSSSRVYRIEDIDIISISFSEKEPEVTYMTVKNGHFKNMITGGTENEWGHRGQYIDYRLVAQFGWRPGSYETSYFNDPKSLFFSAVNRMDVLNAPVNSANVVIPLRPELRPGYPVYIRYLDCFYYLPTFSHQYNAGGSCTTTLQLTGKRAKFYAPGDPSKNGIEAIDLASTLLPRRPLEVLDELGRPRLSGFPNVVMALDPTRVNPLFYIVGSDLDKIDDPQVLNSIVQQAADFGILNPVEFKGKKAVVYSFTATAGTTPEGQPKKVEYRFWFDRVDIGSEPIEAVMARNRGNTKTKGVGIDLRKASKQYAKRVAKLSKTFAEKRAEAKEAQAEINTGFSTIRGLNEAETPTGKDAATAIKEAKKQREEANKSITAARNKQRALEKRLAGAQRDIDRKIREGNPGIAILLELIEEVGEHFRKKHPEITDIQSTANLLDMLADKKASFSNGQQPGAYRYYSASHPDPDQQGQPLINYFKAQSTDPQAKKGSKFVRTTKPSLDARWRGIRVPGYLPSRQVSSTDPSSIPPEAQFGEVEVINGIRVAVSNPGTPDGEVRPTSEIRELMFSVQTSDFRKKRTSVQDKAQIVGLDQGTFEALARFFVVSVGSDVGDETPSALYEGPRWDKLNAAITEAKKAADAKAGDTTPKFTLPKFPSVIAVKKDKVRSSRKISTIKSKTPGITAQAMATAIGAAVSRVYGNLLARSLKSWYDRMKAKAAFIEKSRDILHTFLTTFGAEVGVPLSALSGERTTRQTRRKVKFYSPVFPVSDARGYEVIGSYRYGRDVDIEPDGVFDVLLKQDPFTVLDSYTADQLVDNIVSGRGVSNKVEVKKITKKGNVITDEVSAVNPTARAESEKRVLGMLKRNFTDEQIINLKDGGLVRNTSDPNQLEFGLRNWFAEDSKEGVHKLPINNAAFALSDLQHHTLKRVCDCKAAEADLILEAFGQQEFVQFSTPRNRELGSENDKATQWLGAVTARAGVSWQRNEEALRGQVLDRAGSALVESFSDPIEKFGFSQVARRQDQALERVDRTTQRLDEILDDEE